MGCTIIRNPREGLAADGERESKNSDQIRRTNTPKKDSQNKGRKKFGKQIVKSGAGKRVHLLPLLAAVFPHLAQLMTRNVSAKGKENTVTEKHTELFHTREEN